MKYVVLLILLIASNKVYSHEFTPTYPKLIPSYISGVYVAKMKLLNKRREIEYYGLSVFDDNWTPVDFASNDNILKLPYLKSKDIEIYIRKKDKDRARFICSTSKIVQIPGQEPSIISSKICSRIK